MGLPEENAYLLGFSQAWRRLNDLAWQYLPLSTASQTPATQHREQDMTSVQHGSKGDATSALLKCRPACDHMS